MSILIPYILAGLFVSGVIAICFHLDAKRVYRLGWQRGWAARGQQARQWLRNPNTP